PERPEELNRTEAEEAKRKGKAVDKREEQVLGVTQNLGSIMQKNSFLAEDIRTCEEVNIESDHGESSEGDEEEVEDEGISTESLGDVIEDRGTAEIIPGDELALQGEAAPYFCCESSSLTRANLIRYSIGTCTRGES